MAPRPRIALHDHGDVIASVPHLLGFYPHRSLIVLLLTADTPPQIWALLRTDLPAEPDIHAVANLAAEIHQYCAASTHAGRVLMIVVDDRPSAAVGGAPAEPPYAVLAAVLTASGLPVMHALWTPSIRTDAPWGCYHGDACGGRLPDPAAAVLAATVVLDGEITYTSRDDLAAALAPADPDTLARRSQFITHTTLTVDDLADQLDLIHTTLADAARGQLPHTDHHIADLAHALQIITVRDHCLAHIVHHPDHDTRHLWQTLIRDTPAPHRGPAALLLTVAAYLRGHGVLAGLALDIAATDQPTHPLSHLLTIIRHPQMTPTILHNMVCTAVELRQQPAAD